MPNADAPESLVGGDLFNLITAGLYDNPLVIYREYIQNAADAIVSAGDAVNGKVEIGIDPSGLRVKIRDNGPGLSYEAAVGELLPIARSRKRRKTDRGFRGIGRLSGLAFAESVTFLTRSESERPATRIVWNGPKLRKCITETGKIERAIRECVRIETVAGLDYPAHFFEVEVSGVGRHAAGLILNREAVRTYIGEVCPVPMATIFPFAPNIENLFGENESPLALEVIFDGELTPVTRRYGETIRFSEDREDCFTEFEELDIPSADRSESAAVGWVAHSSYLGAIPKEAGIRGVRARVGNIQIGSEAVFDRLFQDERFNRWCVGEIHVVDQRIVPNGRRDYFEPGPHTRNLENQLGAVIHRIVTRCRKASATRNKKRKFLSTLRQMEESYDLAVSGYLLPKDAKAMVKQAVNRLRDIREENIDPKNGHTKVDLEKLDAMEMKLDNFKPRTSRPTFKNITASEISTYRKVFQILAEVSQSPHAAKEMIEAILSHTHEIGSSNIAARPSRTFRSKG